ncbi:sulfur carrier protein ThiS [Lentibacillus sp. CBA3610]|uniref:sulfur carrier protein ThiS n=1 Tax=Lentibacillus sp. CBA3610 TaxID=2518176 RepID=UPI0015951BE0|nr:sulfur carrier protein ThiS [Lentibacillus sp. CBA3610]QKY69709.1 sulfur carrier protein ThiS [Lentibacillus sp. CBA3610]
MNLLINGSTVQLPEHVFTISDVINHFAVDQPVVIVEYNGEILDKETHSTTNVANGDKLELVNFVGGG